MLPEVFSASSGETVEASLAGPSADKKTTISPKPAAARRIGTEIIMCMSFKKPNVSKLML
ncbi:hypothetical protein D3C74_493990 [compost metagenome]